MKSLSYSPKVKTTLQERLSQDTAIVTDGSLSIELSKRGLTDIPIDVYNLKNPVSVEQIHRDFMEVGAELLQTNTLNANRLMLEQHGLADKVYEINRKGVWIARCVALHRCYVAAVVGPTGKFFTPVGTLTKEEAFQVFTEQIIALLDGQPDCLMFKSFIDIEELEIAIQAAKFVNPNFPMIACKTFPEDGSVLATSFPADIAQRLEHNGVIALGSNSTVGPQRMFDIVKAISTSNIPLVALPDTAIPVLEDGKALYNAEPEYVAHVVKKCIAQGARIVGADGGASVEHIRAIADIAALHKIGEGKVIIKSPKIIDSSLDTNATPSHFAQKIGKEFVSTVEIEIPRGLDIDNVVNTALYLKEHGVDAINIFDGARARVRINPIALSRLVQERTGIECITHFACRDRNMVGIQADLIGADALSVRNILAITGDPTSIGDFPNATSVYDLDAIGLIRTINKMNNGEDLHGNPIGKKTNFLISCAVNPTSHNIEREIRRFEQKIQEGATVAFSQPIFEYAVLEEFLERTKHLRFHFILGIIPLRSLRHAEFLHYEVPGMVVPDWVRKTIADNSHTIEHAAAKGMEIARTLLQKAKKDIAGVYIMPPAKKYSMAVEIIQSL